jgi:hypothetical protein
MESLRRKAQQGQVPVRRGWCWSFVGLRRVLGPISRSLFVQIGDALLGLGWGEVRVHQLPPLEVVGSGRRGGIGSRHRRRTAVAEHAVGRSSTRPNALAYMRALWTHLDTSAVQRRFRPHASTAHRRRTVRLRHRPYMRSGAATHPIHEAVDRHSEPENCRRVPLSVDRIGKLAEQFLDLLRTITGPPQYGFRFGVRNQTTLRHQRARAPAEPRTSGSAFSGSALATQD